MLTKVLSMTVLLISEPDVTLMSVLSTDPGVTSISSLPSVPCLTSRHLTAPSIVSSASEMRGPALLNVAVRVHTATEVGASDLRGDTRTRGLHNFKFHSNLLSLFGNKFSDFAGLHPTRGHWEEPDHVVVGSVPLKRALKRA